MDNLTSRTTYRRHVSQMKEGTLQRWEPPDPPLQIAENVEVIGHNEEEEVAMSVATCFAIEFVEQVVRGRVRISGASSILALINTYYARHLPANVTIPSSWYMLCKMAFPGADASQPLKILRDVCPMCDFVFAADAAATCGICHVTTRFLANGKPARQAAYFDLADILRRKFAAVHMYEALEFYVDNTKVADPIGIRDRHLSESWHGTILQGVLTGAESTVDTSQADEHDDVEVEADEHDDVRVSSDSAAEYPEASSSEGSAELESGSDADMDGGGQQLQDANQTESGPHHHNNDAARNVTLFVALTADGTEIHKNVSYTPVTLKVLNLQSTLRSRMSSIVLLAVLPPHIKNYNNLLRPVAHLIHRHRPGGGVPITLRHPVSGTTIFLYVYLAYTVNDIRGVPGCTGGKHAPCIEGSCVRCKVRGLHRQNRTIVPASVRALAPQDPLRSQWETEFKKDDTLRSYAKMSRPAARSKAEVVPSAQRVLNAKTKSAKKECHKEEPFTSICVLAEMLPYFDVTKHSLYDLAHMIGNFLKLIVRMITNSSSTAGKASFSSKHREYEMRTIGRFEYLKPHKKQPKSVKPKWMASKTRWELVEQAFGLLRAPKEWPTHGKVFSNRGSLNISELMLYAGPIGAYLFQFLDIDYDIRIDIIQALRLLGLLQRKVSTPGDRLTLRRDLPRVFTRLELALPVQAQTMIMHYLVFHTVEHLEATGPFHVSNMLDIERFQLVLKTCARAKKSVMRSIVNNYLLLEASLESRMTLVDMEWTVIYCGHVISYH